LIEDTPGAQDALAPLPGWKDMRTMGIIILEVINTTNKKISVYPNQGTVIAGSEQVDVDIWLSEDVGGDFFDGVKKEGGVVFGLKQADVLALDSVRYVVSAPVETDTFTSLTDEGYVFVISLR
jgi:hypothetical protein